jgi:hypothetical protein
MKISNLIFLAYLVFSLLADKDLIGQSNGFYRLSPRSPDHWFKLLGPGSMREVERHADVDGGFYTSQDLVIDYDFWTYDNTPNFLRDVVGRYSKSPILECRQKGRKTKTRSAKINGKRAIIQQCRETDERKRGRYIYYVTFPKVKVFNGESFDYGMFNLSIRYKDKLFISAAERIVHSIDFRK